MKSIFEKTACDEILARFDKLQPTAQRQWGKMSPSQMLEHCARAVEMANGKNPRQQALMGKMIGWIFKKGFLSEKPFPKNSPTAPDFVISDEPDLDSTRARLKDLILDFHQLGEAGADGNIHGFFGKLSGAEWGVTQYKHLDHHLRQFDC
jgi:Protein of unknown function (DUF1569)